jgi:hypothetical protein
MKRLPVSVLTIMLTGITLAACSSGSTSTPTTVRTGSASLTSADCRAWLKANPTARTARTADYELVAGVGASEAMYTLDQANSTHPATGEIMVAGQMDNGSSSMAMGSGSTMNHVEVHICSKATGKAVAGAMPTMSLQGTDSGAMTTAIPVAEMQGLDRKAADTHYGNNVSMTAGGHYRLTVSINGQSSVINVTAPAMSQ